MHYYSIRCKIFYDQTFKGSFGPDTTNILRNVIAQAQNFFQDPSLTVSFKLKVEEIQELNVHLPGPTEPTL